ncbi:MAG: NBR1-Ig-like domain-containing protein, partial [Phycisphaerae bacterium]
TNDPYQYIKTTAAGARIFNDRPDRNSSILWHNFPTVMRAGEHMIVKIIFRNEGDMMWNEATMFRMGQHSTPAFAAVGRWMIDNTANEVGIYGGVFRGRDVTFQVELIAPTTPGQYATKWSMLQEGVVWFGQELTQNILVY